MAYIEIRSLTKVFAVNGIETPALRGVNLDFERGDFVTVVGPSGSGKSTLFHCLGGLLRPTSGKITVADEEITEVPPRRLADFRLRSVGFVFQAYNLITVLTALENVEYIMLLQGVPPAERRARAEAILRRVGLSDYLHRRPNEMSGGQQQRVAVARAVVAEPKLILADEPTANLDSKTGGALMDLMRELNREKGMTFLFATHDPMVMERASRIVRLRDGQVDESAYEVGSSDNRLGLSVPVIG